MLAFLETFDQINSSNESSSESKVPPTTPRSPALLVLTQVVLSHVPVRLNEVLFQWALVDVPGRDDLVRFLDDLFRVFDNVSCLPRVLFAG